MSSAKGPWGRQSKVGRFLKRTLWEKDFAFWVKKKTPSTGPVVVIKENWGGGNSLPIREIPLFDLKTGTGRGAFNRNQDKIHKRKRW